MAYNTKISWCDATFNPWMGCAKVSPGCAHCYAERENIRYGRHVWGPDAPRQRTSAAYWRQPLKWNAEAAAGIRKRVFCGSWCDAMEAGVYLDTIRRDLYDLIGLTPHLDWLLLTKRPENFVKLLPRQWLDSPRRNVWGMTTVESADHLWRVGELERVPFVVRGLSLEPLLGPLPTLGEHLDGVDWVIVGGESGSSARPMHPDWVRSIRDQCAEAGVPFCFKQWGGWAPKANFPNFQEWDKAAAHALVFRDGEFTAVEGRDEPDEEMGLTCADLDGNDYAAAMARVGKRAAGHLLDGKEHMEFPEAHRAEDAPQTWAENRE